MRMTYESFADYLGVAPRTIAYWHKRPEMVPQPHMQGVLDTALDKAPERVKAQFAALVSEIESHPPGADPLSVSADTVTASVDAYGPDPGEHARIRGVLLQPSRLDNATVAHLTRALTASAARKTASGPAF
jgi:hypothetical protein